MKVRSLRTRFLLSGCLLLGATVACGAWSVLTFARLGAAIDRTLGENQEAVNLAVELIFALEHEDDALLRALNGDVRRAEDELRAERERFAEAYTRLEPHLNTAAEKEVYVVLRAHADAYRKAGDALVAAAGQPAAFEVYSKQVNPTLREAVADCRFFRKLNVEAMGRAGSEARDEARRSSLVVAGIALAALLLSAGVVTLLSRSVLRPVGELDRAVEAVRRDDLERRVPVRSADELGRLADGFNRMAATLAEYRRETEERFHQMAENIHEIFWMTDAGQERMLYVSPAYEDVWGRTCQSLYDRPRSWLDDIHPDDRDRVIENMEHRGRGVFTNVEYRIVRPDGSIRWVRSRAFPINDQNGGLSRIAGLTEDITNRKWAEEAVRESEERFRYLVQNSSDLISLFDAEGTVLYQAPSVERLLGYRPQDRIGQNVFRDPIAHPDDLGRKRAFFDTILSLPGRPVTAEFRLRHADGSWRDIEAIGQNFLHDPSVAGIVANYRDVTERKRSEEETRKAKERLDLAVRGSNLTIWELEMPDGLLENGRATLINAWEPLGHNPIGAPTDFAAVFALTVYPEDQARVSRAVQACLDGETREYEAEYRVAHKDGSNRWHLARGTVLRDPKGRPIRFIGSTVDITDLKRAEVALRESEERFRTLAKATNDAVWDWDLNTNKVWWNEGVLTLFGYRLEANEADPSWWLERVHPDDRASVEAFFFEVVRGKELSWVDEYRFRCADGSYKDVYDRGYVLRDTEGRTVRMIGAVLDITARKRAEEAVRESEHHWRSLAEALPQLVWTCTPDGSCDYLSTQWEKYTGVPAGEQLGWRWSEVLHPDDRERALRCWADAVGGRGNYDLEFRIRRADGEYRWFKTRGVPIRDGAGDVFKWFGTCTDITADKQLEEELRQANARLDLAVRGSNVAIWEIDMPDGVYRNGRGHHLNLWEQLGYDPPEGPVDYATWTGLSHPEDRGRVERAIQACLDGETKEYEAEYRVRHRNGSDRWVLSRGIAVRGPAGKPIRFVGSRTDITDRKRAEKELRQAKEAAEAANRAKDEFLANVSHEIRTPMNAILGMTELALDTPLTEDQRQYLTTVKSAADNLLGLINDLLDFSKIEAGKLELDPADFGLRAALGDTLRALAMRAHRKGLELVCQVQPDVPDALVGDAGRLRQVLLNLVGNAIKFTEEGEVVVRVKVAGDSAPEGEVGLRFCVSDTGIGIPPDKQETIFRAFEQEDTSTTRKYGGTGLGLTIAARLVALMGGQITVDSTPARGSTFAFTARFGRQPHPPSVMAWSPDHAITGGPLVLLHDLRVLIVDDNATNRHILEGWLHGWQMEPAAVGGGLAALNALWHAVNLGRPYGLLLLDARMPDTDGLALAAKIREQAELSATRIILLTSGDRPGDLTRSRELRIDAHLLKPVQQEELLETIYRVMCRTNGDAPPVRRAAEAPAPAVAPLRILVAEDNEFNQQLLEQLLVGRGHRVRLANNGREALALLDIRSQESGVRSQPAGTDSSLTPDPCPLTPDFDLLLLDIHMPELDGFQVVQAVRERERTAGGHLPVVALTARSRKEDRERCLAAGMDDFLAKPIQAADLWAAVDRAVGARPPAGRSGSGLLDPRVLLAACGGDAVILEKICQAFRSRLPDQLTAVQDALRERDTVQLREAAHKLCGMVAAFSTVAGGVASELEDRAAQGQVEEARPLVGQLETMAQELVRLVDGLSLEALRHLAGLADDPSG